MISVKLLINQEHNGLELHFPEKPDRSVLAALTNARWHYHRVKKCWYAKHNDTNMAFAQKLLGSDLPTTPSRLNESFLLMIPGMASLFVILPKCLAGNRMKGTFKISTPISRCVFSVS